MTSRRRWPWLLLLAFVVLPVLEIYVIIQVGQVIGAWWTVLLLIADAVVGSWLVKREGSRAWAALRDAIGRGRLPSRELADGALILIGGTLMISPGFVTDLLGFALILPFTRPLARRIVSAAVARRLVVIGPTHPRSTPPGGNPPRNGTRPGAGPEGPVVQGEVVDE